MRTTDVKQFNYVRGVLDEPHTHHDGLTGSDACYIERVLDGLAPALLQVVQGTRWVIHGASGGCATAVSLARLLVDGDHKVFGVVADCGVPGSGDPLLRNVPCSICRFTLDRYWIANGHEMIYDT